MKNLKIRANQFKFVYNTSNFISRWIQFACIRLKPDTLQSSLRLYSNSYSTPSTMNSTSPTSPNVLASLHFTGTCPVAQATLSSWVYPLLPLPLLSGPSTFWLAPCQNTLCIEAKVFKNMLSLRWHFPVL